MCEKNIYSIGIIFCNISKYLYCDKWWSEFIWRPIIILGVGMRLWLEDGKIWFASSWLILFKNSLICVGIHNFSLPELIFFRVTTVCVWQIAIQLTLHKWFTAKIRVCHTLIFIFWILLGNILDIVGDLSLWKVTN